MKEEKRRYLSGFGNEHTTEASPGALPEGQNAPQRHPLGLYTEQIRSEERRVGKECA